MAVLGKRNLIWLGFAVLLAYILTQNLLVSDKRRIENLIEEARIAAEQEDLETLMDAFDLGYKDEMGLTYVIWRDLFQKAFKRYDDIRIRIVDLDVDVEEDGKRADATLSVRGEATVAATKGNPDAMADRPVGAVDEAQLFFRKLPTGWKVTEAKGLRQSDWW